VIHGKGVQYIGFSHGCIGTRLYLELINILQPPYRVSHLELFLSSRQHDVADEQRGDQAPDQLRLRLQQQRRQSHGCDLRLYLDSVNLEHVLSDIQADRRNLHVEAP
jgi:hypothetical protein